MKPVCGSSFLLMLSLGLTLSLSSGCVKNKKKPEAEPTGSQAEAISNKAQASKSSGSSTDGKQHDSKKPRFKQQGSERKAPPRKPVAQLRPVPARPVAKVPVTAGDPENGEFSLEEATQGLPGKGQLMAEIVTDLGTLSCELYDDKAPITVANFIGLARGKRAWKDSGKWVKKPLYDGTKFHRIIKTFMIQGGDPNGNGSGGPGYVIPDEIWENAHHSRPGLLCMANRGPDTNGSQFFILNNMAPHLDGGYTIFGDCGPVETVDKIASVPVNGQRPQNAPVIKTIKIKRDPTKQRAAQAPSQQAPSQQPSPTPSAEPAAPAKPTAPAKPPSGESQPK